MSRWDENKIDIKAEQVAYRNEVKDVIVAVIDKLEQDFLDFLDQVLECIKELSQHPSRLTFRARAGLLRIMIFIL